jgi:hypothetical protein
MATNVAGGQARNLVWQSLHYLRKNVLYNTAGIATGVPMAAELPAGANIMFTQVKIKTAFNAGTTNVLTVGTNGSSYDNIVSAGDVDESVAEATMVATGADVTFAANVRPYIKYTQSGTAASAGEAEITIVYAPNNDQ